jgi:PAS domain-containing protein
MGSISDGVFTVDLEWRITSFNRAAEEITGMSRKEAIGRLCSEVFRSSMCEAECTLRCTLKTDGRVPATSPSSPGTARRLLRLAGFPVTVYSCNYIEEKTRTVTFDGFG